MINVWGSWCRPCRKEAPDLQAASVETKAIAQFVGITTKDYDPAPAEAFVRASKITYPSIYDPTGKVLLGVRRRPPAQRHPVDPDHRRQGRLAVRVLSEISKITLVDMINDVADGQLMAPLDLASWAETAVGGSMALALPVALLAGLVSFFSPCVVPLLPGYLSYATGLGPPRSSKDRPAAAGCSPAPRCSCSVSRWSSSSPASSPAPPGGCWRSTAT